MSHETHEKLADAFEAQARMLGMVNALDLSKGDGMLVFKLTDEGESFIVDPGALNLSNEELLHIFSCFTELLATRAAEMPTLHRMDYISKALTSVRENLFQDLVREVEA